MQCGCHPSKVLHDLFIIDINNLRNKGLNSLRRIIDSDTNEDTLWLCTNKEEEDEESITLTEKTGAVEQEETFWRFKRKEELKRLDDPTALVPKTMSQVEIEDTDQANDEELKQRYEDDLQKKIKTIDFFEASTTVKKSNISGYGDYNSNNRWALLFSGMAAFFHEVNENFENV